MRKLYSLVLMAAALLIGTNAWAVTEVATWAQLQSAVATPDAEIRLTATIVMPNADTELDLNGAVIDCSQYLTVSSKTGNDTTIHPSLNAKYAREYTLQNATFKNHQGSYGAVYITKAATMNLKNITTTACKYAVRLNAANAKLNVDASSNIAGTSYGIYVTKAGTIENEGIINSIYATADPTISNDGTISNGVFVKTGTITTTITNNGTFTQSVSVAGAFNLENNGTATITAGTFSGAVSFTGSNPVEIKGGKFNEIPTGSNAIAYRKSCFVKGVGGLTIEDGYKWYAATGYIIEDMNSSMQITHANGTTETKSDLKDALENAQDKDVIQLLSDAVLSESVSLGKDNSNKTITLDLNGHTVRSAEYIESSIVLYKGALYVTNSIPNEGGFYNQYSVKGKAFMVYGSNLKDCDPTKAEISALYSYLNIGEGVNVYALGAEGDGIVVNTRGEVSAQMLSNYIYEDPADANGKHARKAYGVANGVRVDVKGAVEATEYGVKVNGTVRYPDVVAYSADFETRKAEFYGPGSSETIKVSDADYAPYIHIYPSAELKAANLSGSTAAYSSGYARWLIEGACQGATGVYIKSGQVTLQDAIVESTWAGNAESVTTGKTSGIEGGGNAVVIESNSVYSGEQVLAVEGDTKVSTEAAGGSALVELVDSKTGSKVDSVVINGGSFSCGENGYAIAISTQTAADEDAKIVVYGTTIEGTDNVQVGTESSITSILADNVHTTEVTNSDGSKTVVVSTGGAPAEKVEWTAVAGLESGTDANWTGFTAGVIASGKTVTLGELQIISGNTTDGVQQLTIENGAALVVDRLILNDYARIIVEAGGKLIVKGEFGINAPVVENIVLKASETEGQAMFLFHPNVTSNRHPNATVEFISNSITDGGNYSKQRFAIPTFGQLSSMTTTNGGANVQTAMSKFYYDENKWKDFGWINVAGKAENLDQMATPFEYYQMQHNTPNFGTIVTMKGQLYGNESPVFDIKGQSWNGYANSYMAPINAATLIGLIPETVDKSFQIYEINKLTNKGSWKPVSLLELEDIKPMQAFLIRNTKAAADVTVDYENAVYKPATEAKNGAPARRGENNMTRAKLIIMGEGCIDRVTVAEGAEFTAEFDNGYDAAKYMNDGINMYVSADEKMGIFATDNLENTYVGLQTVNGGNYTIEFSNVQGNELTLIDHETGAQVAMVEGATYEFNADANSVNDYRFEIVGRQNMPTAIDNTEAVKSAKGVYTITGQYVGEMNVWNTLPAGVYVVNGEKLVK